MMDRRRYGILTCVLLGLVLAGPFSVRAFSEEKPLVPVRETVAGPVSQLSGNLRVDLFGFEQLPSPVPTLQQSALQSASKKSPWLAAGLSLVVPGAGEAYSQSYVKGVIFFAVEVAAWALAYSYDKKGDRQTDFFQNFANQHWSVYRYADWTIQHASEINSNVDSKYLQGVVNAANHTVDWAKLNQLESALGNWYSHNLPAYGEQQYYELIGKYEQFYEGWDDANFNLGGYYDVARANLSPQNQWYAGERGKANNYYTTASTYVTVAIVNHVVSAIDAAWSAGSYNKVHAEVGLQTVPARGYFASVPVVKLRYSF